MKRRKLNEMKNQTLISMSSTSAKQEAEKNLALFYFVEAVDSPQLNKDMLSAISKCRNYSPPARKTLSTTLLDDQYDTLTRKLSSTLVKVESLTCMSDECKNGASVPVTNIMVGTTEISAYLNSFDVSGLRKTGQLLCLFFPEAYHF